MAGEPVDKMIGMVGIGDVDTNLVRCVGQFIEATVCVPVDFRPSVTGSGLTPESAIKKARKAMRSKDILVVALTSACDEKVATKVDGSIGCVFVSKLRPEGLATPGDTEVYHRRIEKETVRVIGEVLGLKACPNPLCVMFAHRDIAELDAKGCTFCPPCLIFGAQRALGEKGVKLIKPNRPMIPRSKQQ
jgi:hypothetical protein